MKDYQVKRISRMLKILHGYEKADFTIYGVFLYREEWIKTDHLGAIGGPFEEDRRILSPTDIENIRTALPNLIFSVKTA